MDSNTNPIPISTVSLLSILLVILSWELTIAMFAAHILAGPGWLPPIKHGVAIGVSALLTLQHKLYGRRQLSEYKELSVGQQPYITYWQGAIVVALMISTGVFATWLFF